MKKFFLSMMIFAAMIFLMPTPDGFPILEYHTVTDTPDVDSVRYNVAPDDFAAQLDYLADFHNDARLHRSKKRAYRAPAQADHVDFRRRL